MTGPPKCRNISSNGTRRLLHGLVYGAVLILIGCAPTTHLRILMRLPDAQKAQYQEHVIRPFEKQHKVRVQVDTYASVEGLVEKLRGLPDSLQPDLVELPHEMALPLAKLGLMRPIDKQASPAQAKALREEFFFGNLGRVDGKQWYWPRHLETPLLLYSKSRAAEAARFWDVRVSEIVTALKHSGLAELRKDYALKPQPKDWDQVDLFVAASFWRQQELRGRRRARISLGNGSPHEAGLALMNRALQGGAASEQLLRLDDAAVLAALRWQQSLCREGLIRPGSYRGETFDSLALSLQAGEVYMAEVTPREAFLAHGNGTPQLPGYLQNPDDMGIAPLPMALWPADINQAAGREGRRGAATRLWLWGLGRGPGDPAMSTALMEHLGSTSSLVYEASNFGLIPARRGVLAELPLIFGGGWAGDIYQAAARQMIENGQTLPPQTEAFADVILAWSAAGRAACAHPDDLGGGRSLSWEDFESKVRRVFAPQLRQSLPAGISDPPASVSNR